MPELSAFDGLIVCKFDCRLVDDNDTNNTII